MCCLIWRRSGRQARSSFPLWGLSSLKSTLWQSIRQLIVLVLINYQLILCLLCMTRSSSSRWLDPAGPPLLLKGSRYRLFHIFSPFALQMTPHIVAQRSQFPSRGDKVLTFSKPPPTIQEESVSSSENLRKHAIGEHYSLWLQQRKAHASVGPRPATCLQQDGHLPQKHWHLLRVKQGCASWSEWCTVFGVVHLCYVILTGAQLLICPRVDQIFLPNPW